MTFVEFLDKHAEGLGLLLGAVLIVLTIAALMAAISIYDGSRQ